MGDQATSPIFTVILSYIFLRKRYSGHVLLTLIPIVSGVTICTFSELESPWGIVVTLFSTLILVAQNLYSKHLFASQKVHEIVLVMNVAGLAFITNLPMYLYFDFFDSSFPVSVAEVSSSIE
jgi:solute carrier family 35, member E2